MNYNLLNHMDIIYRIAVPADIGSLVDLSGRWIMEDLPTLDRGFIRVRYDAKSFESIIRGKCVVVATDNDVLAGYYLISNEATNPELKTHCELVQNLRDNGLIDEDDRVAVHSQALIDSPYQGKGIRQNLLKFLILNVQGDYDYLFSTISKSNPRAFVAHSKDGWKVIDESESMYYVVYNLKGLTV